MQPPLRATSCGTLNLVYPILRANGRAPTQHLPSRKTHPTILPLPNPHKLENPFNPSLRQTRVRRTFLSTEPGIYPQGLRLAHASVRLPDQPPAGLEAGGVAGLIPRGGERMISSRRLVLHCSSRRLVLAATPPGNFLRDVEPGLSNPTGARPCACPSICHYPILIN